MIVLFDTETTGLPRAFGTDLKLQPQIIEFAAIKVNQSLEEVARIEFFANPGQPITAEITKCNGITTDMVKDAPAFADHFPSLQEFFLGARCMVAHNVAFDRKMLTFELQRLNCITRFPWPPDVICTVEASMHIRGRRMKQTELFEHYNGRLPDVAHRAMADVETLLSNFRDLRREGAV